MRDWSSDVCSSDLGLRRIEAVTGRGAFAYLRGLEEQLQRAAALLKTTPEEVPERVVSLNHSIKEKDREIDQLKRQLTDAAGEDILEQVKNVGGFQVLIAEFQAEDADQMRDAAEKFKDKLRYLQRGLRLAHHPGLRHLRHREVVYR